MNKYKVLIILAMALVVLLSSCHPEVDNKGKYENYLIGMYINGKEYHEITPPFVGWGQAIPICGFKYLNKPKSKCALVTGGVEDLGPRNNSKKLDTYCFDIKIYADSALFLSPDPKFVFDDSNAFLTYEEFMSLYEDGVVVDTPKWFAYLYTHNRKETAIYWIKEGWIQFMNLCPRCTETGNTNIRGYYDYASFEFVAESEEGGVLRITDGYCKYGENL